MLEDQAQQGMYQRYDIQHVTRIVKLLGEQDLLLRAERLLKEMPDESFWTAINRGPELPKTVPEEWRSVPPHAELEQEFPLYQETKIRDFLEMAARDDRYLAATLEQRYEEAFALANSELAVEEIAITQAVLGDIEAALESAQHRVKPEFRQQTVLIVVAVESFRRGRLAEARAVLNDLELMGLGVGDFYQLALGFAGRVPWSGYPYPDW